MVPDMDSTAPVDFTGDARTGAGTVAAGTETVATALCAVRKLICNSGNAPQARGYSLCANVHLHLQQVSTTGVLRFNCNFRECRLLQLLIQGRKIGCE
jgi:hypothetical protein